LGRAARNEPMGGAGPRGPDAGALPQGGVPGPGLLRARRASGVARAGRGLRARRALGLLAGLEPLPVLWAPDAGQPAPTGPLPLHLAQPDPPALRVLPGLRR